MGDSAAPMLSNLVILIHVVEHKIYLNKNIKLCVRIIDDTLFICKNMSILDAIKLFKQYHPSFLNVTHESMKNNRIKFMDLIILNINNYIEYAIQFKAIKLEFYVPYSSNHPNHIKINIIKNMEKRAIILCSNSILFHYAFIALIIRFIRSGYPFEFLWKYMDEGRYSERSKYIEQLNKTRNNNNKLINKCTKLYYKPKWIPNEERRYIMIPYNKGLDYNEIINNIHDLYPIKRIVYKLNKSIQRVIRNKDANYKSI